MVQRKPTPIQPAVEIVTNDASLVGRDPISGAIQRPNVPTRAQLMAERQATAMEFQTARSKFAITKTGEMHDHASAEVTPSLLFSKHLERGFVEDELTEDMRAFYASMRHILLDSSIAITTETAESLRAMARDLDLPPVDVTTWDVINRWLETH